MTRTPETLTAVQRAEQLRAQGVILGLNDMSKKNPTESARSALLNGLNLDQASASAGLDPRLEVDGSLSILRIDDIEPYDHNPRHSPNPRYSDLKESIRAQGITNPITVTRRPGEAKYFPFGGGNTRLQIAKELYAEGDKRFATLQVLIKAFPGDAKVIAAHLAENANRGETTFWDNAQGVVAFKNEWEAENEEPIAGAELHEQLRAAGINFGIKMVQNFLFAVEFLDPVGPWLRAKEVNELIRPRLGCYIELAARLNKPRAVSDLREVLQTQAADLYALIERNRNTDPADRVPVELDAQRLVQDAAVAIAKGLEMSVARMQSLADVLQARPRIAATELLALDTSVPKAASKGSSGSNSTNDIEADAMAAPPVQQQLGPLMGVIAGTDTHSAQVNSPAPNSLDQDQDGGALTSAQAQFNELVRLLESLNAIVPIDDCIKTVPEMPFGYFVELPELEVAFEDAALTDLRVALLWFLMICSGQTTNAVYQSVRTNDYVATTRWATALERGPRAMREALNAIFGDHLAMSGGSQHPDDPSRIAFEILLASKTLWMLLMHAQIGPLLIRMLGLMQRMQQFQSISYDAGHLELSSWDDSML